MTIFQCPYCGRDICFNFEDIDNLCSDDNRADWYYNDEDELVILCPYCNREIVFTKDGEADLGNAIDKSRIAEKPIKSKIFGAFAYKVINPNEDFEEFPPEDGEMIGFIAGNFKEFSDIPQDWVENMRDMGANIIAIGEGDYFTLFIIGE